VTSATDTCQLVFDKAKKLYHVIITREKAVL
jgi:hypothetical protein